MYANILVILNAENRKMTVFLLCEINIVPNISLS